ncbi:hypothetical protein [Pedobacter sp. V48]|uniref:hypothetical protein n=1 Tax=Pedobacter sp. V48 TaxID=509635 RepID=UPI0003E4BC59|nr:hypothetical protein [Pedobacter sp. V48]ETZ19127.1 hypothetical protein N824_10315 [Pedobacter sp. V48]
MEGITIGYDFRFNLVVHKRNGKTYKRHIVTGIGINFSSALWDVYFKLKKRKSEILSITSAEPIRVAFAFKGEESLRLKLSECLPVIPEDLDKALKHLPKQS